MLFIECIKLFDYNLLWNYNNLSTEQRKYLNKRLSKLLTEYIHNLLTLLKERKSFMKESDNLMIPNVHSNPIIPRDYKKKLPKAKKEEQE